MVLRKDVMIPLADRILVRLAQVEKVTAGGIIIPQSVGTVQGHLKGEVIAVGAGAKNKKGLLRPLDVKMGDVIYFAEYSGTKVNFNSEDLYLVKETDVLGITK